MIDDGLRTGMHSVVVTHKPNPETRHGSRADDETVGRSLQVLECRFRQLTIFLKTARVDELTNVLSNHLMAGHRPFSHRLRSILVQCLCFCRKHLGKIRPRSSFIRDSLF